MKENVIKILKLVVLLICVIAIVTITKNIITEEIEDFDNVGYNIISKYLISDTTTPIIKTITQLGGAIFVIILAIVLLISIKDKKIGILIWLNLAITTLLNQIFKFIVQRPRPIGFRIIDEKGYSFPSGHSMVSMAFYGFLIYIIYKKVKNKYLKWGLISILGILVISIGISRIYLGVHYTSDVLAGFLISISYLIIFISIARNYI